MSLRDVVIKKSKECPYGTVKINKFANAQKMIPNSFEQFNMSENYNYDFWTNYAFGNNS